MLITNEHSSNLNLGDVTFSLISLYKWKILQQKKEKRRTTIICVIYVRNNPLLLKTGVEIELKTSIYMFY